MRKLKVGIIGCGGIALQKHLPALSELSELCEIHSFCDLIPQRAEDAKARYGNSESSIHLDYRDLLGDESIDVVHVLTPNTSHRPITVDAFAAGKHVLCEKPMAATYSDALLMMDAWRRSGKQFTIGYQNRFRPEVWSLKQGCDQGKLGEIYFAKAHAIRRKAVPTWGVFMDKEKQGGGPLIDIGTHALDMTLWMMGNYEPVSVMGSVYRKLSDQVDGNLFGPWDPKTYDVEDSAFGFIKMRNGATVFLEASWILNVAKSREASTTLCGSRAGAEILKNQVHYYSSENGLLLDQQNPDVGEVAYFGGRPLSVGRREAESWLLSILRNSQPVVVPDQALVVTRILEAIYESAREGREIRFE